MPAALLNVLCKSLQQLEEFTDFQPDDPAMIKLRREITATIIKQRIAEGLPVSQEQPHETLVLSGA